ncbi:MAG: phosphoribosylglycinamide formyltransferase [Candidatus Altiarchaeota archaeon]
MGRLKIGLLASGRGSNLQAVIDCIERGELNAEIAVVVSNKKDALALERARTHGIKAIFVDIRGFQDRNAYERKIVEILNESKVELVVLAGYMLIIGMTILQAFRNRIINIHPALTPSFPGLHAQKQAVDFSVRYSGCTVHFVDESLDAGPIILQSVVPVMIDDTEESLSKRILEQEHKILPEAIRLYSEGRLKIEGRKVKILPKL